MTLREMQIEFERRVTLMDPTLVAELKLTSDTIFSFLNAFTLRYVKQCYLLDDQNIDGSRQQRRSVDLIKTLMERTKVDVEEDATDGYSSVGTLPSDYFMYIRSNSIASKTYKSENETEETKTRNILTNKTLKQDNVMDILTTIYDHRIVVNPYVLCENGEIRVIHDLYTVIKLLDLVYYRLPKIFNVIKHTEDTVDYCELPEDTHMEIVEGAVEMFVTEAKYRLNAKKQ